MRLFFFVCLTATFALPGLTSDVNASSVRNKPNFNLEAWLKKKCGNCEEFRDTSNNPNYVSLNVQGKKIRAFVSFATKKRIVLSGIRIITSENPVSARRFYLRDADVDSNVDAFCSQALGNNFIGQSAHKATSNLGGYRTFIRDGKKNTVPNVWEIKAVVCVLQPPKELGLLDRIMVGVGMKLPPAGVHNDERTSGKIFDVVDPEEQRSRTRVQSQ